MLSTDRGGGGIVKNHQFTPKCSPPNLEHFFLDFRFDQLNPLFSPLPPPYL